MHYFICRVKGINVSAMLLDLLPKEGNKERKNEMRNKEM